MSIAKAISKATLLLLSLATANGQTYATSEIKIGSLQYAYTTLYTFGGVSIPTSWYTVNLDASAVAAEPITFGALGLVVKGGRKLAVTEPFTTAPGCGVEGSSLPCSWEIPGQGAFVCAWYDSKTGLYDEQSCISIAIELYSTTGKNFSFALLNGQTFCAYGINNTFLVAKPGQQAVTPVPVPNLPGFFYPATVGIYLQPAPAASCAQ